MTTSFSTISPPASTTALGEEISRLQPLLQIARCSLALYSFRGCDCPALMQEVARLRESAFRSVGGGTGRVLDMDSNDINPYGYRQLVAWDAAHAKVVGGYRYIVGAECDRWCISTLHYFDFSPRFECDFLPHSIELGRSFTVRDAGASSLFAMQSLWQGLGRIVAQQKGVKYLFGKVTIPPTFDKEARRLLLLFLRRFFPARERLLVARKAFVTPSGDDPFTESRYEDNYALLEHLLRRHGERIPPMIHAYMRLSRQMQTFDAMVNPDFGNAVEVAILLPVDSIVPARREAYIR
ncbi:MAG: hemolysin [Alistipes sp.]|nr:hemolysin [Alistipes sp.]